MEIHTAEKIFEENVYLEVAFILKVPIRKLHELHIIPISNREKNLMIRENIKSYKYDDADFIISSNIYYFTAEPYSDNKLLAIAYLISVNKYIAIPSCIGFIKKLNNITSDIYYRNERIREYISSNEESLDSLDSLGALPLLNFSINSLNNLCKKYKGKAELDNDILKLTFYNVKSGNETEGYIQYKSIVLFMEMNHFNINRVIYIFQHFSYDNAKRINAIRTLHPHIYPIYDATGLYPQSFCWGNRKDDWQTYASMGNFPMMIDLIRTSLDSYNEGSPFATVNKILKKIKILNMIYKDVNKMNPTSSPEEIASHIFETLRTCRECGTLLPPNSYECINTSCRACREAVINCDKCGNILTRGEWDTPHTRFNWICTNEHCDNNRHVEAPSQTESPTLETGSTPRCRICGGELFIESNNSLEHFGGLLADDSTNNFWVCLNHERGMGENIWQFAENTETHEFTDLRNSHYSGRWDEWIRQWQIEHQS